MWAGTWRVGGVLAVSRAFGDRLLKQYVVAEPEVQVGLHTCSLCLIFIDYYILQQKDWITHVVILMQEEIVNNEVEFLVLASDGLWDVVTNQVKKLVVFKLEV